MRVQARWSSTSETTTLARTSTTCGPCRTPMVSEEQRVGRKFQQVETPPHGKVTALCMTQVPIAWPFSVAGVRTRPSLATTYGFSPTRMLLAERRLGHSFPHRERLRPRGCLTARGILPCNDLCMHGEMVNAGRVGNSRAAFASTLPSRTASLESLSRMVNVSLSRIMCNCHSHRRQIQPVGSSWRYKGGGSFVSWGSRLTRFGVGEASLTPFKEAIPYVSFYN